jgi:poly(3-hydroxybutyrate) depolymerase
MPNVMIGSLSRPVASALVALCTMGLVACSNDSPTGQTGSGGSGSGGRSSTGGATGSGGVSGTGGATKGSGGTMSGSGGAKETGGTSATGGTSTGGTSAGSGGKNGGAGGGAAGGSGGSAAGGSSARPDAGADSAAGGSTSAGGAHTDGAAEGGASGSGGQGSGGSTGGDLVKSAGCGKAPTLASNQYNNGNPISITVNGSQRRYILQVPTNYDNTKPYKFLLGIHALNSNDKSVYSEKYYGLQPLSNNTMIFAAPNGTQSSGSPCSGTGTGDSGCGWPSGNNNMELMDAVVKQVTDNFCVDMQHIYASGWSYGASMSYEVGCQRPLGGTSSWGVRAIAIYAVRQMSGSCKPSIPIGYYLSHGINDSVLPYDTGVSLTQNYAKTNGCTWATPPKASGAHICTNLSGCKAGYPVEFCSFVGDHTAYPDSGNESSSWGPAEVWKFLSQF